MNIESDLRLAWSSDRPEGFSLLEIVGGAVVKPGRFLLYGIE